MYLSNKNILTEVRNLEGQGVIQRKEGPMRTKKKSGIEEKEKMMRKDI